MAPHVTKKKQWVKKTTAEKIAADRQRHGLADADCEQPAIQSAATTSRAVLGPGDRAKFKLWRESTTATALASSSTASYSSAPTGHYLTRGGSKAQVYLLKRLTSTTIYDWRFFVDRRCVGYLSPTGKSDEAFQWLYVVQYSFSLLYVTDCSLDLLRYLYSQLGGNTEKLHEIVSTWREQGGTLEMGPEGSKMREVIVGYVLATVLDVLPVTIPDNELPLGHVELRDRLEMGLAELNEASKQ